MRSSCGSGSLMATKWAANQSCMSSSSAVVNDSLHAVLIRPVMVPAELIRAVIDASANIVLFISFTSDIVGAAMAVTSYLGGAGTFLVAAFKSFSSLAILLVSARTDVASASAIAVVSAGTEVASASAIRSSSPAK